MLQPRSVITVRIKLVLGGIFFALLAFLKTSTLFGGDGGDLVTASYLHGVAHPPGYPLYTLLGWILTWLPIDTISGRVTLLSTIPGIITIPLVYAISYRLTRHSLASFIGALTLGSTYIFLLLSVIPEVFSLHLLFVVIITWLLLKWTEGKDPRFWYAFCFFFGLALTHHHTILFVVPGWLYTVYRISKTNRIHMNHTNYLISGLIFVLGLLPYSYVYFAARMNPAINWEDPQTISGFIRLITRAIYGTFRSGNFVGHSLSERIIQTLLFFETMVIDFTWFGIILGLVGIVGAWKLHRRAFYILVISFVTSGPLFLFYASFPFGTNFYLGTAERFYLVPYFFWSILISFGVIFLEKGIRKFSLLILLYPLLLLATTVPKLVPLRNDRTTEHMIEDIYQTVPPGSLVVMTEDTRLFATQYRYFTDTTKPTFTLIHFGFLRYPFYRNDAIVRYPTVFFPTNSDPKELSEEFFAHNAPTFTIFSDGVYPIPPEYRWVATGLLYQLYRVDAEFSDENYMKDSKQLWDSYHDPFDGALGSYKHVMLSDILRVYGNSHRETAKVLGKLNYLPQAFSHISEAITLQPEASENWRLKVEILILQKKCDQALVAFQETEKRFPIDPLVYQTGTILYRACFNDEKTAQTYESKFAEQKERAVPQLKDL